MNELLSKARDPLYNYLNIKTRAKLASTSKTLHKSLQPELTKNRKLNIKTREGSLRKKTKSAKPNTLTVI